ncbi:ABC-three component system protein [Ensifer aridi]|uniref:ABC-three component system protein n=1 Tax=Ensifer aridi TaxID=1708715 RepID=UPI000A113BE3|nr:ABC-three component system protein [Ensifer aridi]
MNTKNQHSADDAALGFLYQGQYALLLLWRETDDDAVVYLETLDDVVLEVNGTTILEQLKHSMAAKPAAITITSVKLWKTLKAWIDVLSQLNLSQTWLHLVTVAEISPDSPLKALLTDGENREVLLIALQEEAKRVLQERADSKAAEKKSLPHEPRAAACEAFLNLGQTQQEALLSRARIKPGQKNISEIEDELAKSLTGVVSSKRTTVAQHLVEWWNRQILLAMAGKREKAIHRFELVSRHMEIVADITLDKLIDNFASEIPPDSYRSHPMLHQQIALVDGTTAEVGRAVRDEWRARENRSRWSNENPSRRELIARHDDHLAEEWSDRHDDLCNDCREQSEATKRNMGHKLLVWSHYDAPKAVDAIDPGVTKPSYVRGSYQVLSINGRVGWHPDYRKLLGFEE